MSKFGIEEEFCSNWQPVLQCQILVTNPIVKATYHLSGILKYMWWLGCVYYTFQCFGYLDTASNWCEKEKYDLLWNLPGKKKSVKFKCWLPQLLTVGLVTQKYLGLVVLGSVGKMRKGCLVEVSHGFVKKQTAINCLD